MADLVLPRSAFVDGALVSPPNGGFDLKAGDKLEKDAAQTTGDGQIRVDNDKVDAWQDVSLPHKNEYHDENHIVQVLPTARAISITYNGKFLAQSASWFALFEIGKKQYPLRYYIPSGSVDQSRLSKSKLTTHCPFKGDASYYSIDTDGQDLAWYYPNPTETCEDIKDTICFYTEKEGFKVEIDGGDIAYPESFDFDT